MANYPCTVCNGSGQMMQPAIGPAGGKGVAWRSCTYCGGTGRSSYPPAQKKTFNLGAAVGVAVLLLVVGLPMVSGAGDKGNALVLIVVVAIVLGLMVGAASSKRKS